MNSIEIENGAGRLLAAADRASRRAPRLHAHALVDLTLDDADRISDEVRAVWRQLFDNLVAETEVFLRRSMDEDPSLLGNEKDVHNALKSQQTLVAGVFDRAHFPEQSSVSTAVLNQAKNIVLRQKLSLRARRVGVDDPVRRLSSDTTEIAPWATALLLAQSISEGPDAVPILSAENQHSLVWAVAAAIRVALTPHVHALNLLDQAITNAARKLLAQHQESRSVDVIAARLAKMAGDGINPARVLLAGYPELSCAILANRTQIDSASIATIQHESDCARLAVLLKISGVDQDDAAKLFVALSEVRDVGSEPFEIIADYNALETEDAKLALSSLRLEPSYVRAVSNFSGAGR